MRFFAIRDTGLLSVEGLVMENMDLRDVMASNIRSVKFLGDRGEKTLTDDSIVEFTDPDDFEDLTDLHADNKNRVLAEIRVEEELREVDWTQLPDVDLTAAEVTNFVDYRQDLRDVKDQGSYPDTIVWPYNPIFKPPDIIGLTIWNTCKDLSSITKDPVTDKVSQWSDKSGDDNHAVQAVVTKQPIYFPTSFNGLPTIKGGSSHYMDTNFIMSEVKGSLFCAFETAGSIGSGAFQCPYGVIRDGERFYLELRESDGKFVIGTGYDFVTGPSYSLGTKYITAQIMGDGLANLWINGVQEQTDHVYTENVPVDDMYLFCMNENGSPARYSRAKISEFIFYDRVLTDEERLTVLNYMNKTEWGDIY